MRRTLLACAFAALSWPLLALQPQAPAAPTVQQQFEAASAALDSENWAEALRLFEALEVRARSPRSLAIIRVRKAAALLELGRASEAGAALRTALPDLPTDEESLFVDRYLGLVTLGRLAESGLDYDEALRNFRAAAVIEIPEIDRLTAYRGMIQTQLFTDAAAALGDADRALRILAAGAGERPLEGQLRTLRGRALLNLHRYAEARTELELAMRQMGNLTLTVDRADLVVRSDLAMAALLAGNEDAARHYLAFTGAGRFFGNATIMLTTDTSPPPCGPDIAPDDVVVIQLLVRGDGTVSAVLPVYASRPGPAALRFARSATDWQFLPKDLNKIPAVLRSAVRIEMRCLAAPSDDGAFGNMGILARRLAETNPEWSRRLGHLPFLELPALRAELATVERGGATGLLPVLVALALHEDVEEDERLTLWRRVIATATDAGVPPRTLAAIATSLAYAQHRALAKTDEMPVDFTPAFELPQVTVSPSALAAVHVEEARNHYNNNRNAEAQRSATAARVTPGLPANDPAIAESFAIEAAAKAAAGDMAGARGALEQVAPGPVRCGPRRRMTSNPLRDANYPREAMRWGFEGWATTESIVDEAGNPSSARVVLAYPPFVFGEATRHIALRARFSPVYRPDGANCPQPRLRVRYAF